MSFSDEMTEEHEAMLTAVGEQQSSVWMFMPYLGVYLSKIGDALNDLGELLEELPRTVRLRC